MYIFIFLGKKDNFGIFEEIFGEFWDCDHYVEHTTSLASYHFYGIFFYLSKYLV